MFCYFIYIVFIYFPFPLLPSSVDRVLHFSSFFILSVLFPFPSSFTYRVRFPAGAGNFSLHNHIRGALKHFVTTIFYGEGLLAPLPSIRNLRTCHAVVTRDPPNMGGRDRWDELDSAGSG
jgi:hypothetical protein